MDALKAGLFSETEEKYENASANDGIGTNFINYVIFYCENTSYLFIV
jgi:hypothetical protein